MMVRKLLKAAIYIKVIVVTTLVTIHEPMADEVMDEFVTSEIMEEEPLAEDTELFEEETNEELNMIATNEEENLNDMMDTMDLMNMELCIPKNGSIHHQEFGTMLLHQENLQLAM